MSYLQDLDMIAYIRFACVYRRFKDVDELQDALKSASGKDEHLENQTREEEHAFTERGHC